MQRIDHSIPELERQKTAPHVVVDARFRKEQRGGDRCRFELATNLIRHSRRSGPRYTFLTYDETDEVLRTACEGPLKPRVVTTACRPNQHPRGDLFEHAWLPLLNRSLGADLYHGTFNVLPLLSPGVPTIVTIHDMAVFAHPEAYGRKFAAYGRLLVRAAIRHASRIITVSDATARELLRYVPGMGHKLTTVLNGVGDEFLRAADQPIEAATQTAQRLGIRQPFILYVGNLERKKNLPRLIEGFRIARGRHRLPHRLVIVGQPLAKGPAVGIGQAEADGVEFAGYVPDADLPSLYRAAALVAYPSIYEGFGMPVLEGMAAGTPVLTSRVSSLPEVAGGAALLVDPFDPEAIAEGLYRSLSDENWRRTAVRRGRERARQLSWQANARQTEAVYDDLWAEVCDRRLSGLRQSPRRRRPPWHRA